ncbi:hypothetical protein PR002_g25243 [Phytophthora rubi]|uniref:ABC transporter domain-containing protein n=1 Tax=Phytophthora rubi TaxID=129364 RepID=A0A6A3I4P9_9STRA|nr:hypothetical protein PR002_g25243 [Phytophthora rubi]
MDVIAGRKTGGGIVGDIIVNGGSLLVEQKKRVTIGVEVVTNPSILFLDEPTSGLDVRSALIVMCGVQSIARTGRTGGYTTYFGDLGVDSVKMLEYFASTPGTMEIRPQHNPAT